jgi:hypothetical protein
MQMKYRIMLIAGAGVLVVCLGIFGAGVSWYNTAVSLEESTKAQYRDNQNQYDAFWKKVKETAQVPDKYKEDFKDIMVSETKAKFGEGGSKAAFQWFKDRDINFDSSVYKKVQTVIETGRNDFKRGQTDLLDKQRKYGFHVKSFWGRLWAGWYDMPSAVAGEIAPPADKDGDGKLTVMDYDIVTSKKTKATFESGEENEPVKVF